MKKVKSRQHPSNPINRPSVLTIHRDGVTMFWGCFIPVKFPWLEKSIRVVLDALGIRVNEDSRFTCCPEPQMKNLDHDKWTITAARNLAIAEQSGKHVLAPCNGCFETLKSMKILLRENDAIKTRVAGMLASLDPPLAFKDGIDVLHLAELFWKEKEVIKDKITRPLENLKVAVHYGCHLIRPSREIQIDNPFEPKILDELVKIVGADPVQYTDKLLCCGGSYERAGNKEASISTIQRKLQHMKEAGAQAVLVACPNCYMQYEFEQAALQKLDYSVHIPVFFITDLIGLALGKDPADLGLDFHVISTAPALGAIDSITRTREASLEGFDIDQIEKCIGCSACVDDCPPTKLGLLDPPALLKRIIQGHLSEVVQDPSIWSCLDCYTCLEMCPDGDGFVANLRKVRNIAAKQGHVSKGFERQAATFENKLRVIPQAKSKRAKLGLPDLLPTDAGDLASKFNDMND